MESDAADLEAVLTETIASRLSERQGRLVERDSSGSLERHKREGYF
jgi:sulfate adenylyltransferase subunit 2